MNKVFQCRLVQECLPEASTSFSDENLVMISLSEYRIERFFAYAFSQYRSSIFWHILRSVDETFTTKLFKPQISPCSDAIYYFSDYNDISIYLC